MALIDPTLTVPDRISSLINAELETALAGEDQVLQCTAEAFRMVLQHPEEVTVNFSGGITQTCWAVSRGDGDYCVVYMPRAGYFSLCVESDFGPLDIGVHGPALGCFGSV